MSVKEESENAGLKLNIQKTKVMASGPTTSWQIEGEKVEAVTNLIFLGSKSTVDGDNSHEIKKCLLFGRKAMTNLGMCAQSSLTLCNRMDCTQPGSSVRGIFQARIPEWVAISFFRESSWPRDRTHISYVSCISRWGLYH